MQLMPRNGLLVGHERDVWAAVVAPYCGWFAAPFDDAVQTAENTCDGKREVDFDAQSLMVEIVPNVG
jgi:hypothetical protein